MSDSPLQAVVRAPALAAIGLVRLYQRFLSPLLPPACRYTPSCSQYMVLSLQHHGFFRGGWLGIRRILRCNPYFRGGFDPPPGLTAAQCGCHQPIAGTEGAVTTHGATATQDAATDTSP